MRLRTIAALAALSVPLAVHATDGYFAHGYGMKAKGMGGASIGVAGQDAFGGANNPALMSFAGNRFDIGLDLFSPWRSASRTGGAAFGLDGSVDSDSNYFAIPEAAFNYMVRPDLALGVTVYGNGGMNTDYANGQLPSPGACGPAGPPFGFTSAAGPYNLLCGTTALGVNLSQLIIAPTLAWQFVPNHSLGISPLWAYQQFEAYGLQMFDNPGVSTGAGSVTNRGNDSSTGWGARFGYYGQFTPQFALGAAYATKMSMGEFDKYKGLFAEQGGFDIPSHWGVGVAIRPTPQWLIALDYERINYSDVKSVNNPSRLILNCPALGGTNASNCLGASDGAGFGWQSVNVFKLGVQYVLNPNWTLRAGYNHTDNPIRSQDVTFNILAPGVVQNHVTLGATYAWQSRHELTGAFMYAFNNDVTGPSLYNNLVPGLNAQETIEMSQWSLGVQYSYKF
jgi:long-chain fatty acid transport protein